jgi:hypothetical protein
VPLAPAPFHRNYIATDCTQAVITFRQLPCTSPICPVSLRSRAIAFLPFFNMAFWWSLRERCESSQTPSHRVTLLLKGISRPSDLTVAVGPLLLRLKKTASVLLWSKDTPFPFAPCTLPRRLWTAGLQPLGRSFPLPTMLCHLRRTPPSPCMSSPPPQRGPTGRRQTGWGHRRALRDSCFHPRGFSPLVQDQPHPPVGHEAVRPPDEVRYPQLLQPSYQQSPGNIIEGGLNVHQKPACHSLPYPGAQYGA